MKDQVNGHELTKIIASSGPKTKLPPFHQWCVCAVSGINQQMSPPTYLTWNQTDWTCTDNATLQGNWPRSFWIVGHPMNANYPATSVGQNEAFYDLVCNSVGQTQLTNGQQIVLDSTGTGLAMCSWGFCQSIDRMCIVYRGYFSQAIQTSTGFPNLGYQIYKGPCCDGSFPNTSVKTSWDCVQIGDHPKFGFKCTEIQGTGGQYLTKQDCLFSGCEGIADPGLPTSQTPAGGFTPLTGGTTGGVAGATTGGTPLENTGGGGDDASYGDDDGGEKGK